MTPRISLLVLAGVTMAACSDTTPTAPDVRPPLPRYSFSDGARGGNPDFFFLFPLGIFPSKSPHWDAGKADPDMKLVRVEICELPQCTTVIQEFDADDITVVRPGQHASDEKDENYFPAREAFYRVIWRTARAGIDPAKFYRIRVLVGHIELGFVDVDPVQTLRQLAQVDRTRYAGVLLGLPFPIRFRIEQGALCENNAVCATSFVDRDVGGTFYAPDEGAAVNFGPGDLPEDVMVTIERVPVPPGAPCVTDPSVIGAILQQWEGCYRITTAPDVTLTGDVELAVCLEPGIPEDVHHNLLLYKFDDDQGLQRPDPIEPPFPFSCEGFSGTPAGPFGFFLRGLDQFARALSRVVSPKPLYAVDGGLGCILRIGDSFSTFFWGLGVNARAFGGTSDDLEVPAGDAVPNAPSVRVTSAHSDMIGTPLPMPGVPVTFQVVGSLGELRSASGATVSSIQVMTNSLGIAALPTGAWVTSTTLGAHTVRASGPFVDGPIHFTAVAVENRVISFEAYPDGTPACASCPVTDEFASRGVVFSFTPREGSVQLFAPQLILSRDMDPAGSPPNHSVTAAQNASGGFVPGTVSMIFAGTPTQVRFRLRGDDVYPRPLPVVAYNVAGQLIAASQITRSSITTFTTGWGFLGREELVTVISPSGISRVEFPPSFLVFIDNLLLEGTPPPSSRVSSLLAAGGSHTCALDANGAAFCWGANISGQLGNGAPGCSFGTSCNFFYSFSPVPVIGSHRFMEISSGAHHSCGLTNDGMAFCWGLGNSGQLGRGNSDNTSTPTAVAGGHRFVQITAGVAHTCGLTSAGEAYCWGTGPLGHETINTSMVPVRAGGSRTFARFGASGSNHVCALDAAGLAYCWGDNIVGQLGDGTTRPSAIPVMVAGNRRFTDISLGSLHTCAVEVGGAAYCWGRNQSGELGHGSTGGSNSPVAVAGGLTFTEIAAASGHSCGLITGGAAYCWGYNNNGHLGNGTTISTNTPVAVTGGRLFAELSAGSNGQHTCGRTQTGEIYCWGVNSDGRLGNGDSRVLQSLVPIRTASFDRRISVSPAFTTVALGSVVLMTVTTTSPSLLPVTWTATGGSVSALDDSIARYVAPSASGDYEVRVTAATGETSSARITVSTLPPGTGYWRFEGPSLGADSYGRAPLLSGGEPAPAQMLLPAVGPTSRFPRIVADSANDQAVSLAGGRLTAGLLSTQEFTIEAFVHFNTLTGAYGKIIAGFGDAQNVAWFLQVRLDGLFGNPSRELILNGVFRGQNWVARSGYVLQTGVDYYVAASFGANVTFWIQDLTNSGPLRSITVPHTLPGALPNDTRFVIGDVSTGAFDFEMDGFLDEVRLTNRRLIPGELLISRR